ncbi:ABC transporter permease [Lachnobacterium bovis]|uniref:ABC transporter permease n=1 Tax=Lachnobacterium bovis TaxID=140626 RepID=UPI0003B703D2|nr:ABC transporter permease [Lachnobacterium bovis]
MKDFKKQLLAGPYLLWMIGFIILPMLLVVYYAFFSNHQFTLDNVMAITSEVNFKAILLSLKVGILSTLICLLLSYPLALILKNINFKNQSFIVFLFMLPMWMNFMLRILAWKILLSKNGILNTFLYNINLPKIQILNTSGAIIFGMVYDYLPFMLLPIYNSMAHVKKDYIEAAQDLGASKIRILFQIIIPLTMSGIVSGIVMVFVPTLTSFAISELLGGGKVLLIGNVIEHNFMQGMRWGIGSGLSFVLMVFVFISMILSSKFGEEEKGGTGIL